MINRVKLVCVGNEDCLITKSTNQAYPCSYEFEGKTRIITEHGMYKELSSQDANPPKTLLMNFSKTVMFHEYVYEVDKELQTPKDKNTQMIVDLFWKNNPICIVNGKAHANTKVADQYNIVDAGVKTVNSVNRFNDVMKGAIAIQGMTHAERCDVAFYYGQSPIGKSEEELLIFLSDVQSDAHGVINGYCLKAENLDGFLRVWVNGKAEDREMLVVVKKAIAFKTIDNKAIDGRNNYYLGESFLGIDETGIVDWCRKHPRDYTEHILRSVNEKNKEGAKSDKSINKNAVDLNKFDALKKQALELKEEGFIDDKTPVHSMGAEKLTPIVEAALMKKEGVGI